MTITQREAIVREAEAWLRTPYHDHGRVKGAGADCALFPLDVYSRVLGLDAGAVPHYVMQWHLHRDEEIYLNYVRGLPGVREIEAPGRGDFALWRVGRVYSHGAIVMDWPRVIHAVNPRGVVYGDATSEPHLCREQISRPLFFTFDV